MIEFERVYKAYGDVLALRGASFRIPRGALAGLLGPNGSGKTTSLKLMVGLIKPNAGLVSVNGYDPWVHEDRVRELVGFLPERPIYPSYLKVGSLLRHLARLRGLPWSDAVRIARLVGIEKYLDTKIGGLSRGYLQRFGLAQALLGEPEILLLDEPTANLDPHARMEILELIAALKRDLNATVLISSHILPELQQVIDYVVLISGGRVVDYGPLGELSSKYRVTTVYVARSPKPRSVARLLIEHEHVSGVMLGDDWVEIHADPGFGDELKRILSELQADGLVSGFELKTGYLGELYERAIRAAEY